MHTSVAWSELQGETKILKLKNLRPQDYANYSCIASVRNVCGIPDRSVIFTLTNRTGTCPERAAGRHLLHSVLSCLSTSASPSIKLLVEDPIVVNPGQTVSLVCITTGGEPPPLLTWVSSNDSLPERSVVNGGTLTLPAITSEEAGAYSCVASNNVGNPAKKSTTIVVRGEGHLYVIYGSFSSCSGTHFFFVATEASLFFLPLPQHQSYLTLRTATNELCRQAAGSSAGRSRLVVRARQTQHPA